MLLSLQIKNYVLIDSLNIDFSEGLNIFTGETGAGKSIIFDAISILLGGKVSSSVVRTGANRCIISGFFYIEKYHKIVSLVESRGIEILDGGVVIRREIDESGKSKCYLNDIVVSAKFLQELGELLVDIHGQHEHQSLLNLVYQREYLDNYAQLGATIEEYRKVYENYKVLKSKLEAMKMTQQEKERLVDLYKFQLEEIKSANLKVRDEEYIRDILPQLKNLSKLKESISSIWLQLYEDENSLCGALDKLEKKIHKSIESGAELDKCIDSLNVIKMEFEEIKNEVSLYRDKISNFDESQLDLLIEKLDKIERLKKKYGNTTEEILNYAQKTEKELETLQMSDDIKKDIEKELEEVTQKMNNLAEDISGKRKKFSEKLTEDVLKELKTLGMPKSRFVVVFEKLQEPQEFGIDKIEFFFTANPGEKPRPLKDIISGGELSRFMLALKTIESGAIPILIFDEIDSGISGPMGQVIGKKLSQLSKNSQVIVITHLPQIAAFAQRHFLVEKTITDKKTITQIKMLNRDNSVREIARMLSGKTITDTALRHADELLRQASA